jgi:hypothetical protein
VKEIQPYNRDAALEQLRGSGMSEANLCLSRMWIYQRDLEYQMHLYANRKSEHGRLLGRKVIEARMAGEKSADVAAMKAEQDDEVFNAHLAYRVAEQMITADKEALRILHSQLDQLRTEAADRRAADQFQARTQP